MSFGITEALVVLAIVLLVFGTGKLKNMGSDLGGAIKGFRKALNDDGAEKIENGKQPLKSTESSETKS